MQPDVAAERLREAVTDLRFEPAEPAELGGKIGRPVPDIDGARFKRSVEPGSHRLVTGIEMARETGMDPGTQRGSRIEQLGMLRQRCEYGIDAPVREPFVEDRAMVVVVLRQRDFHRVRCRNESILLQQVGEFVTGRVHRHHRKLVSRTIASNSLCRSSGVTLWP